MGRVMIFRFKLWWEIITDAPNFWDGVMCFLFGWLVVFTIEIDDSIRQRVACDHEDYNSAAGSGVLMECGKCGRFK